jgi:hypothetical protein
LNVDLEARSLCELQSADGDLARARISFGIEADLLAIDETANVGALESCRVHEYVVAAFIGCNEAEAFLAIVEFNGTLSHNAFFILQECT